MDVGRPDLEPHTSSARDNPRISPEFLAEEQRHMHPGDFAREYLAEFGDTRRALFREGDVRAAVRTGIPVLGAQPDVRPIAMPVRWANLMESARLAARGKRERPDVARFLHQLEPKLCRLQSELLDGGYRPAGYRGFGFGIPSHGRSRLRRSRTALCTML